MIIAFLILSILIIVASIIGLYKCSYGEESGFVISFIIGIVLIVVSIVFLFNFVNDVKQLDIIDKKIEMYQEENTKIENDIDVLVKQYMEHEKSTLKEFKPESSITLINLYPDLKANELVQQQIKIYTENNNKIKELKENKLNYQVSKWWLYFGKAE